MESVSAFISVSSISIDASSKISIYRQLYEAIRSSILSGRLIAGTRLPSTRSLAIGLNASRNTVARAYEILLQEGLLESQTGSGTFVNRSLPTGEHISALNGQSRKRKLQTTARVSNRGQKIAGLWGSLGRREYRSKAFRPRLPALDAFPLDVWSRLISRRLRNMPSDLLTYSDPAGYYPLREIISSYLSEASDLSCDPGQIIVVTGTPQATALAATVLLDQGDPVWIEDPGYPRARVTLMASDADLVAVPLDSEGIDWKAGLEKQPNPRMIYVTPSHQYPMGMRMSLSRRIELSQWAQTSGTWILEDDYGTEFRSGIPLASLQGFGSNSRVIYMGTFSNVLFPALSLAYLVVPDDLVDSFIGARVLIDRCPPLFNQVVLADFIAENHFERHIKRLKNTHKERHRTLVSELDKAFGPTIDIAANESGMQLTVLLPDDVDDRELSSRIKEQDIEAPPLSFYSIETKKKGLVLGYAAVNNKLIRIGVNRMKPIVHEFLAASNCGFH